MNVLIIEDESLAAERLEKMLFKLDRKIAVLAIIDSVEDAVEWLGKNEQPNLIFMDIMLADGQSFEIFEHIDVKAPVIFITAFDEYSIKAFKVNSIDYLLKPIEQSDLEYAIKQYDSLTRPETEKFNEIIRSLIIGSREEFAYKKRFLIKQGNRYIPVQLAEIAYFSFEDKLTHINTADGKQHIIDHTLDELERVLDPSLFFRLNRQYIASLSAITSVHHYFNGKLKVYVKPDVDSGIMVSRERAGQLKKWLDQ